MKLNKKIFIPLTLLAFISACSQSQPINTVNTPDKVNINQNTTSITKLSNNLDITGKVDWNKSNSKFSTKAIVSDIANNGTVSLIYPYNHGTNPNKVIATGLTDSSGEFTIKAPAGFIADINTIYILEVSKRIGGATNSLMSLRTYIKRNSNNTDWDSITMPTVSINSKTTALAIITSLESISPDKTIGTMTVSNGTTTSNDIFISPSETLTAAKIDEVEDVVAQVLDANYDPLRFINKVSENYVATYPIQPS